LIKIVHVITGLGSGGAEGMLTRLVTASTAVDIRHVVISLMDEGIHGRLLRQRRVPLHTLRLRSGLMAAFSVFRLADILRRERADIVQTWLYHADLLGLMAAKLAEVPHVMWNVRCTDRDMRYYKPTSGLVRKALAGASHAPDAVIVNSLAGQKFHSELGYQARAWHVLPNGIDVERFRPNASARVTLRQELGLKPDSFLFGFVARMDPMKNHIGFLKGFAPIARAWPDTYAVLVGRGADRSNAALRSELSAQGLDGRVLMMGERIDLPAIVAGFDAGVLPSLFGEGFPNVVAEAMACGVPCVVADVGEAGRIVGDNGFVLAPGDRAALTAALSAMRNLSADERRRLGESARRSVIERYALPEIINRYESIYRGIAGTSSVGRPCAE
jgi:glycosyltransferase involved in cell wall biosynthesis